MRLAAVALSLSPLLLAELVLRSRGVNAVDSVDAIPWSTCTSCSHCLSSTRRHSDGRFHRSENQLLSPRLIHRRQACGTSPHLCAGGIDSPRATLCHRNGFLDLASKLRLEAASPETPLEVINCGGVSYASYRVSRILDEVLKHQPDAIVLYTGHNEFLEDREYAEVRQMSPLRRWFAALSSKIRIVTWIQKKLTPSQKSRTVLAGEVDARLDHAGGLDRYQRDPIWKRGVENHFAETLREMTQATAAANVPLILCVPAGDLVNTPPFKVTSIFKRGTPADLNFEAAWKQAIDLNQSASQRLIACEACLRLDPQHAGANYILGRLRYERGEIQSAKTHLIAARDFDVCPLRATSPIIQSVFELADAQDLLLVDTETLLDERNHEGQRIPDGIADPEYFVDHVHPSVTGHQLIGREVFTRLNSLGWFEVPEDAEQRYEALAQDHLNTLGEAYYARGSQRLEGLRRWAAGRAGQAMSMQEE